MSNPKYIIRQMPPEVAELSFYFEDDGLTEAGGDYCNNLFILDSNRWGRISGFNTEEYKKVMKKAEDVIDGFDNVIGRRSDCAYWTYASYKEVMEDFGIPYNSRKCHALKQWAKDADAGEPEDIAAFLTITTGKKWDVTGVCGYCQGDYVQIVYCPEYYQDGVRAYGEVWLGCASEFGVIELDENGKECDACYGYIVADCQVRDDEDYKRIVSEWDGVDENQAQLEMFDGYTHSAKWRIA